MFSSPDPFPPYPPPRKLACVDCSELPVGFSQPEHQVSLQGSHLLPAAPCCPPRLSASFSQQPALVIGPTTQLSHQVQGSSSFLAPFSLGGQRLPANTNPEKLHYPLWPSLRPTPFVNCSFIQFSWILFKSATQFECAITFLGKTLAHTVPFGVSYSYCFPGGTVLKNPLASAGHARDTCSNPLGGEDPLE